MKRLLWLDDMRDPADQIWVEMYTHHNPDKVQWVRNYDDFVDYIKSNGLPEVIFFDHDLGEDVAKGRVVNGMSKRQARKLKKETVDGYQCAKWLVEYCLDNECELPVFESQSANPVGKENIMKLLTNFERRNAML